MPRLNQFSLSVFLLFLLSACDKSPAEKIGYFKGHENNRVFQLLAVPGSAAKELKAHAKSKMHSEGSFTIVFIHQDGSPTDRVTSADNYLDAVDAMYNPSTPSWRWRLARDATGKVLWTDCKENPSDICR